MAGLGGCRMEAGNREIDLGSEVFKAGGKKF
jgi:hypothetical protein